MLRVRNTCSKNVWLWQLAKRLRIGAEDAPAFVQQALELTQVLRRHLIPDMDLKGTELPCEQGGGPRICGNRVVKSMGYGGRRPGSPTDQPQSPGQITSSSRISVSSHVTWE